MSDFNKGDFTQQGIDGHVRATLRLNEKRYVELDLTTNENARGCTISGNVHDRLNNLDYPIGAAKTIESKTITENGTYNASSDDCDGYNPVTVNVPQPSGNIAITENTVEGSPLNIAQYATATVNVSGGGESPILCTVTVVNNTGAEGSAPLQGCRVYENGYINSDFDTIIAANTTVIYTLVLIKGADDYYCYGSLTDGTTSLMENCSINTGDFAGDIIPTNPTEPCSFTVILND